MVSTSHARPGAASTRTVHDDPLENEMSPPPTFYTDPARALLALNHPDPRFTGPDRLAREIAEATIERDDEQVAASLGRAWRSGAPEELLESNLSSYASVHGLGADEAAAIMAASRFVTTTGDEEIEPCELFRPLVAIVPDLLGGALAAAQGDEDPCWCPLCIGELAALN